MNVDTLHRTNDGECIDCTRSYNSQCHRFGAYSTAFSAGRTITTAAIQLDAYQLISDGTEMTFKRVSLLAPQVRFHVKW